MPISVFAGTRNAWDYAYGLNPATSGTLQVISGSTAGGSYTITCFPAYPRSAGGELITISTSTPITIGGDSGLETVTPTAVSFNNLNQVLITATFANQHGSGSQVYSGSFGLQEAIAAASVQGGTVAIDGRWSKAGGTQATVVAATFPNGVGLLDNRFGANFSNYTYTLTQTQILNMQTTAVQLLPTAAATDYWQVNNAIITTLGGTGAMTGGSAITIGYGTAIPGSPNALSGTIAATILTTNTAPYVITVGSGLTSLTTGTNVLGKGVYISNQTTSFVGGGATTTMQVTLNAAYILG